MKYLRRWSSILGILATSAVLLFPPFTYVSDFPAFDSRARTYAQEVPGGIGHHFILDPPTTQFGYLKLDLGGIALLLILTWSSLIAFPTLTRFRDRFTNIKSSA